MLWMLLGCDDPVMEYWYDGEVSVALSGADGSLLDFQRPAANAEEIQVITEGTYPVCPRGYTQAWVGEAWTFLRICAEEVPTPFPCLPRAQVEVTVTVQQAELWLKAPDGERPFAGLLAEPGQRIDPREGALALVFDEPDPCETGGTDTAETTLDLRWRMAESVRHRVRTP